MYDLHNNLLSSGRIEDLPKFKLKGISALFRNKFDQKKFSELKGKTELDVVPTLILKASRASDIKRGVERWRNQVDILMVHAKSPDAMRAASNDSSIDVIAHAFVDQSAARDAAANNIALEINMRDILSLYGMRRAILLSKLGFTLSMARKYKTPLILTTGAHTIYDMRSPRQIMALSEVLGFTHEEAKNAVMKNPKEIVMRNREKRTGKRVAEGVKKK